MSALVCVPIVHDNDHVLDTDYVMSIASELRTAYDHRLIRNEIKDSKDSMGHVRYESIETLYGDFPRWTEVERVLDEAYRQLKPESNLRWKNLKFYHILRIEVSKDSKNPQRRIPSETCELLLGMLETAEAWERECWP
jgi:hypothetical protein